MQITISYGDIGAVSTEQNTNVIGSYQKYSEDTFETAMKMFKQVPKAALNVNKTH